MRSAVSKRQADTRPAPLRRTLRDHQVETAFERGWEILPDGDLLDRAEIEGFHVLVTTDQNLGHPQSLVGRQLSILVLMTTDWRTIRRHTDLVSKVVAALLPGAYVELSFPRD